ncbi:hypothetical protein I3760_01G106700 [Carya illinoinensis]|nr:hypothetical protein I3760_01G106700 [Carya illinoinensis]
MRTSIMSSSYMVHRASMFLFIFLLLISTELAPSEARTNIPAKVKKRYYREFNDHKIRGGDHGSPSDGDSPPANRHDGRTISAQHRWGGDRV